jgi:hypothetical protein
MYKLLTNPFTNKVDSVIRTIDNACIPFDIQNVDYQAYLAWCAEGNVAISADEVV